MPLRFGRIGVDPHHPDLRAIIDRLHHGIDPVGAGNRRSRRHIGGIIRAKSNHPTPRESGRHQTFRGLFPSRVVATAILVDRTATVGLDRSLDTHGGIRIFQFVDRIGRKAIAEMRDLGTWNMDGRVGFGNRTIVR